jgi:ADP-ribose pyrophosphatase
VSIVASAALGADPAAIATWYWGVVDGLISRIQAGYAINRNSAMQYLTRHGALHGAQVQPVPGSLDVARLRKRLEITGPIGFKSAIAGGQDTDEALRHMATNMSGVADEAVRNGDRDVITRTATSGRGVVGWRRRLSGRACGFCSMLASRGAVYVNRASATVAKDGMAFHPHCHCWAEPLYREQREPAEVQRLQAQWRRITAGHSGKDAQRAWMRHWDRATPRARQSMGLPARPGGTARSPGAQAQVRPILLEAKSPEAVSRVLAAEYRRITGHDVRVDLRGSVDTAREHAEGVLRVIDRYPDIQLDEIATGRLLMSYAELDGRRLIFSERYSSVERRQRYLSELAGDSDAHWHPFDNPAGMAVHEMGHALDVLRLQRSARAQIDELVQSHGGVAGAKRISGYAETNTDEFIAEAFADAMMNGSRATPLSRAVLDVLDAEYARAVPGSGAGGVLRAVPSPEIQLFPSRWGKGTVVVARYADGTTARIADDIPDAAVRRLQADLDAAPNRAARVKEIRAEFEAFAARRFARSEAIDRLARENDIPNWAALTGAQRESALKRRGIAVPEPIPAPFTVAPRKAAKKAAAPVADRYPLAPGHRGATAAARQRQREEVLTLTRDAPGGARNWQGTSREHAEALESLGYLQRTSSGTFTLTDRGRGYFAQTPAAPPATPVPSTVARARITRATKSRTEKAAGYPERAPVPTAKAPWTARYPDYDPPDYTARVVLDQDRTIRPGGWADPPDPRAVGREFTSFEGPVVLDELGRPMNPFGRTGIQGRGLLGKWGQNPAADPIITRYNPDTGKLEMAVIRRGDTDEWAIPGGMVDDGEQALSAAAREFLEETGADLDMSGARQVYRGYVDDPRNTDNAWMETTVMHRHLSPEEAARVRFGDAGVSTGEIRAVRWEPVTPEFVGRMYASHGTFVREALKGMPRRQAVAPVKAAKAAPAKKAVPRKAAAASDVRSPLRASDETALERAAPASYVSRRTPSIDISDEERAALRQYRSVSSAPEEIQAALRAGDLPEEYRETVAAIDAVMARSRLTEGVVADRGIFDLDQIFPGRFGDDLVGAEWIDRGYLSTTISESEAASFAFGGPRQAVLRIHAPAGTPGVQLSSSKYEAELLLGRGLRLRVIGDRGLNANGARLLDVEIIPTSPTKATKAAKAAPAKKATPRKAATPPAPQRMSLAALRTELDRAGVTVPPRTPKATLVDEVTALRGGATPAQVTARLNPPEPMRIDRTLSPAEVLEQERRARTTALAAPPVKLQDLPQRGAGGAALRYYQRHGDAHMLGLMRRGRVGAPPGARGALPSVEEVQASIDQIRRLMDQSVLTEGITVFRGMASVSRLGRGASEPGSLVGRTFRDKGFVSTSADRRIAMDFMSGEGMASDGVLMEVRVPAGTRAIQVSSDTFTGKAPTATSEREILLQDGLRFRVVSDEMVTDVYPWRGEATTGEPYRHIVVEVIP